MQQLGKLVEKVQMPIGTFSSTLFRTYYLELLLLIFNFGQGLRASANFKLFYDKVCDGNILNDTICDNLDDYPEYENLIQAKTAHWLMLVEIVTFVPCLLSATFFGAQTSNQKTPTLVSLAFLIMHTFLYMTFLSLDTFPLYSLLLEAFFTSFGGGKTVFLAAQFTQAAKQTDDKSKLSRRYAIITACLSLSIFFAGLFSSYLLLYMSLTYVQLAGMCGLVAAFFWALVIYPQEQGAPIDFESLLSNSAEGLPKIVVSQYHKSNNNQDEKRTPHFSPQFRLTRINKVRPESPVKCRINFPSPSLSKEEFQSIVESKEEKLHDKPFELYENGLSASKSKLESNCGGKEPIVQTEEFSVDLGMLSFPQKEFNRNLATSNNGNLDHKIEANVKADKAQYGKPIRPSNIALDVWLPLSPKEAVLQSISKSNSENSLQHIPYSCHNKLAKYGSIINPARPKSGSFDWFWKALSTYKTAWNQIIKPRDPGVRCQLLILSFVGLIYACADSGMDVVSALFVYHEPLSWSPSIFSTWMAIMNIVQVVGGLSGLHLLRKINISDHKILLIGLTSSMLKMITTGIASKTWIMFLAILFGSLSNMGLSSLRAIVATLGSEQETGQLISIISIVIGWAPLVSSILMNNFYIYTLDVYHGLTFLFMASLLFLSIVMVLVIYFGKGAIVDTDRKKEPIEETNIWFTNAIDRRDSLAISR